MADADSRAGARYTNEEIFRFVDKTHASHDGGLEAAFNSPGSDGVPAIQVGPSEGKLLDLLVRMVGARKIVEVGTLAGYSAIRMAQALPADGKLWTIEYENTHADVARRNLATAGVSDKVEVVVGAAMDVLPTLEKSGPFDVVFVDADKGNYHNYGAWAAKHLRPGGLLIGDNAYLFGNLMQDSDRAKAMRQFHEEAAVAFHSVCVPTPDGMLVGIKR